MPRSGTFKIVHTFYLLVIAVLLTLLFVERRQQPEEPSTSTLSEQLESTEESMITRVRELSEQMDSRFAALEERLPHEQDEPRRTAPPSSLQDPPVNSISDPEASPEDSSAESAEEPAERPMSSGDYARLASAMTDDFDARKSEYDIQSVDPDWAYPTLELIREQFADHEYLRGLHLADIECRSSICQVDIHITEPASINPARLFQALNGINDNEQGLSYLFISRPLDETYRILIERSDEPQAEADAEAEGEAESEADNESAGEPQN